MAVACVVVYVDKAAVSVKTTAGRNVFVAFYSF